RVRGRGLRDLAARSEAPEVRARIQPCAAEGRSGPGGDVCGRRAGGNRRIAGGGVRRGIAKAAGIRGEPGTSAAPPRGTLPKIFINYRRDDATEYAIALKETLAGRFGGGSVFMDVASIEPGEDYRDRIERSLQQVHFALVLMGKHWCDITDERGRRRLDAPDDLLRFEIAAALRLEKKVIPILLGGAELPEAEALPPEIKPMLERHALAMRSESWEADKKELFDVLDPLKPVPPLVRGLLIGAGLVGLLVVVAVVAHYFWREAPVRETGPAIVPSVTGRP